MAIYRACAMYRDDKGKKKRRKSPFWAAQLRGPSGKIVTLSTKIREQRIARKLQAVWVRPAEYARNEWLTADKAKQLLEGCRRICAGDSLKQSEWFLDQCLRESVGVALMVPTTETVIQEWLAAKAETGKNAQTHLLQLVSGILFYDDQVLEQLSGRLGCSSFKM